MTYCFEPKRWEVEINHSRSFLEENIPITLPNDKIIITVAMTGALVTKKQCPDLPEQPDEIAQVAKECVDAGAAIAHIHGKDKQGQNTSDVEVFKEIKQKVRDKSDIIKKGLVQPPYCINLVLGMRYQGACDATPKILTTMIDFLPDKAIFNCVAVGTTQLPTTTLNMLMGGCVRVGLEDNIYYGKGDIATNQRLVERTVRIARELGKEPMSPEEARAFLGIKPLKGQN